MTYLVFFPLLARDRPWIELALVGHDDLLSLLARHHTSVAPGEVVHVPEGVQRETAGKDWRGHDIDEHPPDHLPLAAEDEDYGLKTVDGTE